MYFSVAFGIYIVIIFANLLLSRHLIEGFGATLLNVRSVLSESIFLHPEFHSTTTERRSATVRVCAIYLGDSNICT